MLLGTLGVLLVIGLLLLGLIGEALVIAPLTALLIVDRRLRGIPRRRAHRDGDQGDLAGR